MNKFPSPAVFAGPQTRNAHDENVPLHARVGHEVLFVVEPEDRCLGNRSHCVGEDSDAVA